MGIIECRHCSRPIETREDGWASPDADGSYDDPYICEDNDTFVADHEPETCGEYDEAGQGALHCPLPEGHDGNHAWTDQPDNTTERA